MDTLGVLFVRLYRGKTGGLFNQVIFTPIPSARVVAL